MSLQHRTGEIDHEKRVHIIRDSEGPFDVVTPTERYEITARYATNRSAADSRRVRRYYGIIAAIRGKPLEPDAHPDRAYGYRIGRAYLETGQYKPIIDRANRMVERRKSLKRRYRAKQQAA